MSDTKTNTNKDKSQQWKEREIGALWKKKNDSGSSYCTGYLTIDEFGVKTKKRVIMFSNKNKTNENSPDLVLYLSNEDNAKTAPSSTASSKSPAKAPSGPKPAPVTSASDDDDIPAEL